MDGRMNGWTDVQMDGWRQEWRQACRMDAWMDGWINGTSIIILVQVNSFGIVLDSSHSA